MSYENNFRIVGIDVGWVNLAMVCVDVDMDSYDPLSVKEKFDFTVVYANMTDLRHVPCRDESCMFERSDKNGGHVVHHYVEAMHEWFSTADKIVIERQPVQSVVEQLLLVYIKQRYSKGKREHVKLIAPQTMHAYFNMSNEKVDRRIEVVEITREYLEELKVFKMAEYKDHLGDSLAFVLYYIRVHLEKHRPNPFDNFKYDN